MEVVGELFGFFETGTEGTIWAIQDENFIDKVNGYYDYKGLVPLRDFDILTIYDKDDPTKVLWEGELLLAWQDFWTEQFGKKMLQTEEGSKIKVGPKKTYKGSELSQLNFGGYWVHTIPMGLRLDLTLWYDIFFVNSSKYRGKIVRKEKVDETKSETGSSSEES